MRVLFHPCIASADRHFPPSNSRRWMTPVIKEGNKRILTEIDMPELPKVDTADHLRNLAQVSSSRSICLE